MSSSNIPFSVMAPLQSNYTLGIYIGDTPVPPPSDSSADGNVYWIVVIDRTTLNPVYNEYWSQPDTAPPIPSEYNDCNYLLVVVTWAVTTPNMPSGAFYDFLVDNGADGGLQAVVQANSQIGCGSFVTLGYTLVGQMGEGLPSGYLGIEAISVTGTPAGVYLPMELVPADVNGSNIYTPSRLI